MLAAILVLQEDLALIKQLLCCDALHPQALNSCLPCLQRPSAYGCFLRFWVEVVTMLAQHALCNIQDKALCTCRARCQMSAHAIAAGSCTMSIAQELIRRRQQTCVQQGAIQVKQDCLDRLTI